MAREASPQSPKRRGFVHYALMGTAAAVRATGRWLRVVSFLALLCLAFALPVAVTVSERAYSMFAGVASFLIDSADLLATERKKTAVISENLKKSQEHNSLREKQIKSQNLQISEQKKKLTRLEVEANARTKQLRELTAQVDDMKVRPAKTKVRLGGELISAEEAILKTRRKVDQRFARSLSKEIASLGAEAIPYVGIAVMIAFLVDDVRQSCESVQDIQDLANAFTGTIESNPGEVCALAQKMPTIGDVWHGMIAAPMTAYRAAKELFPEFQWQAGWDDLVENFGAMVDSISGWIGIPDN